VPQNQSDDYEENTYSAAHGLGLLQDASANRPYTRRNDCHLHRESEVGVEEVDATTEYQRLYNEYLDTFRDIICYAAQIYGFYYEIGKLTDNMGSLTKQLKANPGGAVAVALLPNRSAIYREILIGSLDIVNDIRQVCLSNIKMTEKQRAEIVFAIRPKLKTINKKLQHLTLAVKYSSMSDVWNEIDEGTIEKADNAKIAKAAKLRWKLRARKVK
jgi:hypothetical protein